MDVKDAGSKGGKSAWVNLSKDERSEIMRARNRKAWLTRPRAKRKSLKHGSQQVSQANQPD